MGEHFDSSLYTLTDLFWPAVVTLRKFRNPWLLRINREIVAETTKNGQTLCQLLVIGRIGRGDRSGLSDGDSCSEDNEERREAKILIPSGSCPHREHSAESGPGTLLDYGPAKSHEHDYYRFGSMLFSRKVTSGCQVSPPPP